VALSLSLYIYIYIYLISAVYLSVIYPVVLPPHCLATPLQRRSHLPKVPRGATLSIYIYLSIHLLSISGESDNSNHPQSIYLSILSSGCTTATSTESSKSTKRCATLSLSLYPSIHMLSIYLKYTQSSFHPIFWLHHCNVDRIF